MGQGAPIVALWTSDRPKYYRCQQPEHLRENPVLTPAIIGQTFEKIKNPERPNPAPTNTHRTIGMGMMHNSYPRLTSDQQVAGEAAGLTEMGIQTNIP